MEEEKSEWYTNFDRYLHAIQGRLTSSLSPGSLMSAYFDWAIHLANSPGKQAELCEELFDKLNKCLTYAFQSTHQEHCEPCEVPFANDRRFRGEEWQKWPFNTYYQTFLLIQKWWLSATTDISGLSKHHQDVMAFVSRQLLDIFAPTNFISTNPEVLRVTRDQFGVNLIRGYFNFLEDFQRKIKGKKPAGVENFRPGEKVAVTDGKVVFRNELVELIQYSPATDTVYAEPVLFIPAWIMKYYILDLSPNNSLVKYLVDQGHTVFMVSWKNPGAEDREMGMDDYLKMGILAAIEAVSAIVPDKKIHAVGYCLGGTLLAIAAAFMSRNGDDRLQTLTLFAAQTDFTEAGELTLFIDKSQVDYLKAGMWYKGFLDTKQMAGAFQLLRSNDLIWSRIVHDYLLGNRSGMIDLMAWNSDATRMPYRMHSQYLKHLFLHNELSRGIYELDGRAIAISDIHVPAFIVSTTRDHVAPWKSVYKFNLSSDAEEVTFVLTSGGHNAGIISEPGHPRRKFQIRTRKEGQKYLDPDTWVKTTTVQEGSWWPAWHKWLVERSSEKVSPPLMGAPEKGLMPLEEAPGQYVLIE